MTLNLPEWTTFDPSSKSLPGGLGGDAEIPGPGLVAFVADSSVDTRWAAEATLSVARGWVSGGRNVFVADLALDEPVLNQVVGIENGEGVSDVFMFGASLRHVARPVQAGGYLLATAGTAVGDPTLVLSSERWTAVLDGFREAGVILIAFVPGDSPGLDSLLARALGVVQLAGPAAPALAGSSPVLARMGPAGMSEVVEEVAPPEAPEVPVEPVASAPAEFEAGLSESVATEPVIPEPEISEPVAAEAEIAEPVAAEPVPSESEDDVGGMFDMGGLPTASVDADAPDAGDEDLFSMDALEGSQYSAPEHVTPSSDSEEALSSEASEPEVAEPQAGDFDFDGGFEEEAVDVDAAPPLEEAPAEVEAPDEDPSIPAMEIEGSMLVDESAMDAVPTTGMMEGIETGSGFEMPSDDVAPAPSDEETDAAVSHEGGFDFGDEPLEMDAPDESEEEPAAEVDQHQAEPLADVEEEVKETPAAQADPAETAVSEPSDDAVAAVVDDAPGEKRVTAERQLTGLEKLQKAHRREARTRQAAILGVTLLIVGGGAYGLMFTGIISVPGITPAENLRSGGLTPVDLDGAIPTTPVMSHALLTESYNDFTTAWTVAGSLGATITEALFYVAPVVEGDRTQWGLFVGPAYSVHEAEALRQPVDDGFANRFDATAWRVLGSGYAFYFGEYDTPAEAETRVGGLLGGETAIPTYVLQVDYADGSAGYRVYGGAYADGAQAAPMEQLLRDSGIEGIPFTERRGKPPE